MKWLGLSLLLATSSALASNALIRICRVTGGVYHQLRTSDDEIGMCRYGNSMLDSLSLLEVTSDDKKSAAVEALETLKGQTCQQAGAKRLDALDLEDHEFSLCLFNDGSVVEAQTLRLGGGAANNTGLMQAIRTRF